MQFLLGNTNIPCENWQRLMNKFKEADYPLVTKDLIRDIRKRHLVTETSITELLNNYFYFQI